MKKLILILFPLLILCGSFEVYAKTSGKENSETDEHLVKTYTFKQNFVLTDSAAKKKKTYHLVAEFDSVDNGDGTQTVKVYKIHHFAVTNYSYTNLSGQELVKLVIAGKTKSDRNETKIQPKEGRVRKSSTETLIIPAGLEYDVYYYL